MSARTRGRSVFAIIALLAMVAVFIVRLVDIQIVQADGLNAAAAAARSGEDEILGTRGQIVDRNGNVLADSVLRWDIALSPKMATKNDYGFLRENDAGEMDKVPLAQAEAELGAAVGKTGEAIHKIITDALAADPDSDFAYVAKGVDADTLDAVNNVGIPWVVPQRQSGRIYPAGAVAGNLLGFVGSDGVPQAGIEASEQKCLASSDGAESYTKGVDGIPIPGSTVETEAAHDGGTVQLTIDSDLQWFVQQTLTQRAQETGAAWGTVVVQEAKTGKLLAVADYPTVDPNNVDGAAEADRGSRAFTAPFEPGSTFKAITAASAVDAGVANPLTQVVAPGKLIFPNGANINDSERHDPWNLTLTGVLIESSNTGMSQIADAMSDQQRFDYMQAFGFGTQTEANFYAEESGDLHGGPAEWDNQTKYATSFGQGLTVTAVQMASAYQTIANGGVRMPVQLVSGCTRPDGTVTEVPKADGRQVVSAATARTTTDMLEMVNTQGWLRNVWNIPGYRVASKTGTAQMPDGNGGYTTGFLVSAAGFAPADDPQYVVSVSLADPVNMNTSGAAAPIFKKVMSQLLTKFRVVPSGAPAPDLPAEW